MQFKHRFYTYSRRRDWEWRPTYAEQAAIVRGENRFSPHYKKSKRSAATKAVNS